VFFQAPKNYTRSVVVSTHSIQMHRYFCRLQIFTKSPIILTPHGGNNLYSEISRIVILERSFAMKTRISLLLLNILLSASIAIAQDRPPRPDDDNRLDLGRGDASSVVAEVRRGVGSSTPSSRRYPTRRSFTLSPSADWPL